MHDYPPEFVMSGPYEFLDYQVELVKNALGYLRPDNAMYDNINKKF
jgi:hypothetical protein